MSLLQDQGRVLAPAAALEVGAATWMGAIDTALPLSELTIPGTHNAGATRGGRWVACQHHSISEQLLMGVRHLDLRVRPRRGRLGIFHGTTYQDIDLEDVLELFRRFLLGHPTESILVSLMHERSGQGSPVLARAWQDLRTHFADLLWDDPRVPTLGRARGKVVVITRDSAIPGIAHSEFAIQDDWHIPGPRVWARRKWPAIRESLRAARSARGDGRMWLCHVSSNGWALPPRAAALMANQALARHLAQVEPSHGERNGVVLVDFATPVLVEMLAARNLGHPLG